MEKSVYRNFFDGYVSFFEDVLGETSHWWQISKSATLVLQQSITQTKFEVITMQDEVLVLFILGLVFIFAIGAIGAIP